MSLFSRRQSEARAVLEADMLRIAEHLPAPDPTPLHIDTFNRFDIVKLHGTYGTYAGIVLEADRSQDSLLVKWWDREAGTWMVHWWYASSVEHMHTGISTEDMREVARALLETGRLPRNENSVRTEAQTLF